jgi:hypothetical protein
VNVNVYLYTKIVRAASNTPGFRFRLLLDGERIDFLTFLGEFSNWNKFGTGSFSGSRVPKTVVGNTHTVRLEVTASGAATGDWIFGLDDFFIVPTTPYAPIDGVC